MNKEQQVRQSFLDQAEICGELGSEFMNVLLTGLGNALDRSTITGSRILDWDGYPEPKADALALRLAGAIHALVRRGDLPELAPFYADPRKAPATDFIPAVLAAITSKDDEIAGWLASPPQTNEVARSAVLHAGLQVLASRYDLPFLLFELGSSAGLNLQLAEFSYNYAGSDFGRTGSRLKLKPDWKGTLPPQREVLVVQRRGCDLNPLSVENKYDREKLVAYVWPDQPDRISRVEAAINIARKDPPHLECVDAADWVEGVLSGNPEQGAVRVLFHTIAWNYFPQTTRDRIEHAVITAAEKAGDRSPLAWLSFEFEGAGNPVLRLRDWPLGNNHVLASADPHVHRINWRFG